MKHIVGFSGGIDSQACALWVRERYDAADIILVNSDAGGNEHPITTEHVAEYGRTVFPVTSLRPILADMWKTPFWAETSYWMWSEEPLTFELMAKIKGRFPSRKAQFCTENLKINPMLRWVKENLGDEEFVRYTGVRRDESNERSKMPEVGWDAMFDCEVRAPLVEWKKQQCFDYVRAAAEPINLLYSLGFDRVGCSPCVNSGKDDIANWARRSPGSIDKVRWWEEYTNRTFFAPCVPKMMPRIFPGGKLAVFNWVDEVVEWAKTDYGGFQFNILKELDRQSCESSYGLCE